MEWGPVVEGDFLPTNWLLVQFPLNNIRLLP